MTRQSWQVRLDTHQVQLYEHFTVSAYIGTYHYMGKLWRCAAGETGHSSESYVIKPVHSQVCIAV